MNNEQLVTNDEHSVNERIEVIAKYGTGRHPCVPVKFKRSSGREITITEIGLVHPTTQGNRMVHMFDVTDGGTDYRLEFDGERLTWYLTREGDRL